MRVKICGLSDPAMVDEAVAAGADYVGIVLFPKSPRNVSLKVAGELAEAAKGVAAGGAERVALVVNPDDALIEAVVALPFDMIQLHGSESAERVEAVRRMSGMRVMKAVGVAEAADLAKIDHYADVADQVLIDAKPPKGGDLPGGNGLSFDWRLLQGRSMSGPWMLAGGLTPDNAAEAVRLTGATQLDVSSGVETAPGIKDAALIRRFIQAAK
ncbi:MAG: phosphoribosylanthranilate isomerase [Pikeienuella sp.]